jgi:hypothetical protein
VIHVPAVVVDEIADVGQCRLDTNQELVVDHRRTYARLMSRTLPILISGLLVLAGIVATPCRPARQR